MRKGKEVTGTEGGSGDREKVAGPEGGARQHHTESPRLTRSLHFILSIIKKITDSFKQKNDGSDLHF